MLSKHQQDIIIETLKPFNPSFIGVFDSYALGDQKTNSDIDLLVDLNYPKLSLFDIGGLYYELEQKLNVKIDLAFKNNLKPELKLSILKDVVDLFKA